MEQDDNGKEALEENDEVLVEQAWHLFNNADIKICTTVVVLMLKIKC